MTVFCIKGLFVHTHIFIHIQINTSPIKKEQSNHLQIRRHLKQVLMDVNYTGIARIYHLASTRVWMDLSSLDWDKYAGNRSQNNLLCYRRLTLTTTHETERWRLARAILKLTPPSYSFSSTLQDRTFPTGNYSARQLRKIRSSISCFCYIFLGSKESISVVRIQNNHLVDAWDIVGYLLVGELVFHWAATCECHKPGVTFGTRSYYHMTSCWVTPRSRQCFFPYAIWNVQFVRLFSCRW